MLITVSGLDEIVKLAETLTKSVELLPQKSQIFVNRVRNLVREEMDRYVPRKTGALAKSLRIITTGAAYDWVLPTRSDLNYARFVARGTGLRGEGRNIESPTRALNKMPFERRRSHEGVNRGQFANPYDLLAADAAFIDPKMEASINELARLIFGWS